MEIENTKYDETTDSWMTYFYEDTDLRYERYEDIPIEVVGLWDDLGDIPVDDDGYIEEEWNGFSEGTDREDIWHWFENKFHVSVAMLMYGY